MRFLHIYSRI